MVNKRRDKKSTANRSIVGGIVTILLSPILYPIVVLIGALNCHSTCSVGFGVQTFVVAVGLSVLAAIIGITILIKGIVKYNRMRR